MSAELKERTKVFALRILKLVAALPKSPEGRIIAGQIGRSGTAVGANYRASCRARSKAEFIAKIGIVEEEADETAYWLELIAGSGMMPAVKVAPLLQEADELTAIMASSRITTTRNRN